MEEGYIIQKLTEIAEQPASDRSDSPLKYANKLRALEMLGRHIGAFEPKAEEAGEGRPLELPARLIAPPFLMAHLDLLAGGHRTYLTVGGRGSGKSSFLALELVQLLVNHPLIHGACCRKVGATLRDSVYAQIQWAIGALGLAEEFEYRLSPLEIVRPATGQRIYFRGADDPMKLKSIKPPFGHIGVLWLEELDQFEGEAECRSIVQSMLRGGDEAYLFQSFNPPKACGHWANRLLERPVESRLVVRSDYRDMPPQWLGRAFLEEAEALRRQDSAAWEHEYLGVANGGGAVFENLVVQEITDGEIAAFERPLCGVDWGYYPDPWAFCRMHFDAPRRTLYIFDEATARKMGNRETAQLLLDKGVTGADLIMADSAEPKSIADYRAMGLNCRGAEKGPGSLNYSMKWLQSLRRIVVDPRRCPDTCAEFAAYRYATTADGEVLTAWPDRDNHHIDAVRYGTEHIWKRRGT